MSGDDEDFEFHWALQEMAPAAARTLIELARRGSHANEPLREEAVRRLRQMQRSGLLDELPVDLRHEVERLLDAPGEPDVS